MFGGLRKNVDVILAPYGAERSFSVRLPMLLVATVAALFVLFVLLGTVALLTYSKVYRKAMEVDRIAMENDSLRAEVSRVAVLEAEMADLLALKRRVLELAGARPELLEPLVSRKAPVLDQGTPAVAETGELEVEWDGGNPNFLWPVHGPVSQGFRVGKQGGNYHPGIDIAASTGTPVLCVEAGVVSYAGEDTTFGTLVIVDHGNGVTSLYGHNSRLEVSPGQKVKKGSVIAFVGNTGRSSAPHLHLEIRKGEVSVNPLDYLGESPGVGRSRSSKGSQ